MIVFAGTWVLVYVLYALQLYETEKLHGYTWIILLTSNMTVLLGFYVSYIFSGYSKIYYRIESPLIRRIDSRKIALIIIVIFLLSLLSAVVNTYMRAVEAGGLFEYFLNPMKSRGIFVEESREARHELRHFESLLAIFKNMNYVAIVLSSVLFTCAKKYRFIAFLPLVFAFLESITTFGRFFFITNAFLWFGAVFYVSAYLPDEERRRVFGLLIKILTFLAFIVIFYFIYIVIFRTMAVKKYATQSASIVDLVGQHVYSYIVGNIILLDRYLLGHITYYHGASIFMNFIKWFNVLGLYEDPRILTYFYHYDFMKTKHFLMNTYTYVRYLYGDFGEAGLIPLSFIWGFLSYKMLVVYLKKFSLIRLYLLSLLTYSLFMSFFFFYFKMIMVPMYCSLVLLLIERKTRCIEVGYPENVS